MSTNDIFSSFATESDLLSYCHFNPDWYNDTFKPDINDEQETVLHRACRWGFNVLAKNLIIFEKMDVNALNFIHFTPLHYAAARCDLEVCLDLVRNGANVDAKSSEGFTPFWTAIQYGSTENVEYLAGRCEDLKLIDQDGRAYMHLLALKGFVGASYELICRGIPVDILDNQKNTPLHLAVRENHPQLVELLVKNGANLSLENSGGLKPSDIAGFNRNYKILLLLKKLGDPNVTHVVVPKVKDKPLPVFEFHPNPLQTGSLIEGESECDCCHQLVKYYCPCVVEGDEMQICPWCIAKGKAAKEFDTLFNDIELNQHKIPKALVKIVEQKTPPFSGYQCERWLACCNQPCVYLGKGGLTELTELGDEAKHQLSVAILKETDHEYGTPEGNDCLNNLEKEGDGAMAYFFHCAKCGEYQAYSDCT